MIGPQSFDLGPRFNSRVSCTEIQRMRSDQFLVLFQTTVMSARPTHDAVSAYTGLSVYETKEQSVDLCTLI